jgi:C-terminal processing protease CtpA/Prc
VLHPHCVRAIWLGRSNQFYLNHKGENLEGIGLVPDVPIGPDYPSKEELDQGTDSVLKEAVALLSSQHGSSDSGGGGSGAGSRL